MEQREFSFFEYEASQAALVHAAETLGLDDPPTWLFDGMNGSSADQLNDFLVSMLEEPGVVDVVSSRDTKWPCAKPQGFGMRLRHRAEGEHTDKVVFFSLRESWRTARWSLLGLALGIMLQSPTAVVPALALMDNLRRNLLTLERPKDAKAIDTYAAFLKNRTEMVLSAKTVESPFPSTSTIHQATGHSEITDTIIGLTRLRDVRILEVKAWGGEADDNAHMENVWSEII